MGGSSSRQLTNFGNSFVNTFNPSTNGVGASLTQVGNQIKNGVVNTGNTVAQGVTHTVAPALQTAANTVASGVVNSTNTVTNSVVNAGNTVKNEVTHVIAPTVTNAAHVVASATTSGVAHIVPGLAVAGHVISNGLQPVGAALQPVTNALQQMPISQLVQGNIPAFTNSLRNEFIMGSSMLALGPIAGMLGLPTAPQQTIPQGGGNTTILVNTGNNAGSGVGTSSAGSSLSSYQPSYAANGGAPPYFMDLIVTGGLIAGAVILLR